MVRKLYLVMLVSVLGLNLLGAPLVGLGRVPDTPGSEGAGMQLTQNVRGLLDDPALLGYWTLDEASGNALDSSESQADMVPSGAVQYGQAGQIGSALGFDGSSAYLTSASKLMNVRGSFSVGAWVYIAADDATGSYRIILGNGDWNGFTGGMALALEGDDSASIWMRTTQPIEPWMYRAQGSPLTREEWHFLTGVYDAESGTMKLFVDGSLQNSRPITPTRVEATSVLDLQMGATPGLFGATYFKGRLDEVFYLGRALSDSEVSELYTGTFTPSPIAVPPWHSQFGLSPMGARLQTLAGMSLRGQGYQYWWRGVRDGSFVPYSAPSLLDPGNELRQAMVALLDQAGGMSDPAFEAALDDTAMLLWTYGDYPLVSAGSLPRSLSDTTLITMTAARDEVEARGLYVTNLYAQPLRVQVAATGFSPAVQNQISLSYVAPEISSDALLSYVKPLETGNVFEIPALQSRQLWIEVDTTGLPAGSYSGSISLVPEAYGDGYQSPSKSVALHFTVYDIALDPLPPFDNFTYNSGGGDHIDHLVRNRVNWISMSEPYVSDFDRGAGTITLDFTPTDGCVADAQRTGTRLLSIYGFLRTLDYSYGISWNNASDRPLILSYFTQWVDHLENDLGLSPDDYVIYLWDEPEQYSGVSAILADVCPQLKSLRPDTRLGNTLTQSDAQALSGCLDLFIPARYSVEMNSTTLAFYQNLQTQGKRVWTYDQKAGAPEDIDTGDAPRISPVDLYRYRPWKSVWNMDLDGVAFWSSWYAYELHGEHPAKGIYAWREGLEDTEWILRLQARVDYLLGQPGYDGIPYANIQAAQAILDESNQDPYFTQDYTIDTLTAEKKINSLRRRTILALLDLYPQPVQTCHARINDAPTDYTTVQAAVDAALPGDTVKVAGTCSGVETRAGLPQTVYIDKNLTLQGGYTTTNWTTPDPVAHPTTLDALGQGRVFYVTGDVDVTVAGLVVTGGDAAELGGSDFRNYDAGGGGYVITATFTLRDSTFYSNTAYVAGGLWLQESAANIHNATFESNHSDIYGSAVGAVGQSLEIRSSTFISNTGGTWSGTLSSDGQIFVLKESELRSNTSGGVNLLSSPLATIEHNTISYNSAGRGAGMDILHSNVRIVNNLISGNVATGGMGAGGLYVGSSHVEFEYNLISVNTATNTTWGGGGGIYLSGTDATFDRDWLIGNSSTGRGGGLFSDDSNLILRNTVVAQNSAALQGSGLYAEASRVTMLHGTIADNTGGDLSGLHLSSDESGTYEFSHTTMTMTNTIVSGQDVGVYAESGNQATLDHTLWWNNATPWGGSGTIVSTNPRNGDPAFVDPAGSGYHITAGSAARDAGVNAGVRRDVDNDVRSLGAGYDIGADEYPGVGLDLEYRSALPSVNPGETLTFTAVVTGAGTGTATGVSLSGVMDAAQRVTAIASSLGSCTITDGGWGGGFTCSPGDLAPGADVEVVLTVDIAPTVVPWQRMESMLTATSNETQNAAKVTIHGQDCQATVNGGQAHDHVQAAVDAAAPGATVTISGVCLGASERSGSWQQVYLNKDLTLQGNVSLTPTLDLLGQGRGLYITGGANVTVERLHLENGDARLLPPAVDGGGIYVDGATATLRNLEIEGSRAYDGGGIAIDESAVTVHTCHLHHNTAYRDGGGIGVEGSDVDLYDNSIANNTMYRSGRGAGISIIAGTGEVRDNFIYANRTDGDGGGVFLYNNHMLLAHNAIYNNRADWSGGGLYATSDASLLEANRIHANSGRLGGGIYLFSEASRFTNTFLTQNHADDKGSALYIYSSKGRFLHSTIADNSGGYAIFASSSSRHIATDVAFTNTIISGHTQGISTTQGSSVTLANTLWWDNATDWAGNVVRSTDYTGNPAFVDAVNGDYHLTATSAALDRGLGTGVSTDFDEEPRLMGSAPDLGADEFPQAVPSCDYFNDFEGALGAELTPTRSDVTPVGARRFWGQFVNETATLSLDGCADHDYVTVDFDLYTIRSWDGNSSSWGPDIFDLSLGSGETLLHTTFSNAEGYGLGEEQGQAYPGNYPGPREYAARTGSSENDTLGYSDPYRPRITDAVYHLTLTFPHSGSDLALDFSASGLVSLADESWGLDNLQVTPHVGEPTHFVGIVAFDNNLSAYADDVIDRVRLGTLHNRSVRATLLVDRRGEGNTEVLSIADGVVSPVVVPGIGAEVDTADPDALATFLLWARARHPGHREVLALIGHGTGLSPEIQAPENRASVQSDLPPLPRGHDFTPVDVTSGTYLSTPELGQALDAVTNNGNDPLDLIFFDQCFAGNLETLYEVRDAADVFVASPNYAWALFAYREYLAAIMPSATNAEVAQAIVDAYGSRLDAAHPYTIFWMRGADVESVADTVSSLGQALQAALGSPGSSDEILAASLASRFVDTTLCQGDLALCPPDEMVDLQSFAEQLRANFAPGTAVHTAAQSMTSALNAVHVRGSNGSPWIKPEVSWDIAEVGLTVLAPLTPTLPPETVWRASLYTDAAPLTAVWSVQPTQTLTIDRPWAFASDGSWDDFIGEWYAQGGVLTPTVGQWCYMMPPVSQQVTTPTLPIHLTADSGWANIQLSWNPTNLPEVAGYRVMRALAGTQDFVAVAQTQIPGYFDADPALEAGSTYCYRVEALWPGGAEAATSDLACATFHEVALWVPDVWGAPGETAIVPVNIRNADGLSIAAADIWLDFDAQVIEPLYITRTALTTGYSWAYSINSTATYSRAQIAAISTSPPTLHNDGSLFWLVVEVQGDVGATSPLNLKEFIHGVGGTTLYATDDLLHSVPLTLDSGLFHVDVAYVTGDLNGNGVVEAVDALLALKIAVGELLPTPQQRQAGDINGNGVVDAADSTLILHYAARGSWPLPDAEDPVQLRASGDRSVTVKLDTVSGVPGGRVRVGLRATDLPAWAGGEFALIYDPRVVTPLAVERGDLTSDFELEFHEVGTGLLRAAVARDLQESGGDGVLVWFTFQISSGALHGTRSPLVLAEAHLNDAHGRDLALSALQYDVASESGALTITIAHEQRVYLPLICRAR